MTYINNDVAGHIASFIPPEDRKTLASLRQASKAFYRSLAKASIYRNIMKISTDGSKLTTITTLDGTQHYLGAKGYHTACLADNDALVSDEDMMAATKKLKITIQKKIQGSSALYALGEDGALYKARYSSEGLQGLVIEKFFIPNVKITDIAGAHHKGSFAMVLLAENGTVWCLASHSAWFKHYAGLNLLNGDNKPLVQLPIPEGQKVEQIAGSRFCFIFLMQSGELYGCGENEIRQISATIYDSDSDLSDKNAYGNLGKMEGWESSNGIQKLTLPGEIKTYLTRTEFEAISVKLPCPKGAKMPAQTSAVPAGQNSAGFFAIPQASTNEPPPDETTSLLGSGKDERQPLVPAEQNPTGFFSVPQVEILPVFTRDELEQQTASISCCNIL